MTCAISHIRVSDCTVTSALRAALLLSSALWCACGAPAFAQDTPDPPPTRMAVDPNGINVTTAAFTAQTDELTVPNSILSFHASLLGDGWRHNLRLRISCNWTGLIELGDRSDNFGGCYGSDPSQPYDFTMFDGNGDTWSDSVSGPAVLTEHNGTKVVFDKGVYFDGLPNAAAIAIASTVTTPTGEVLTYWYKKTPYSGQPGSMMVKLQSVTSNYGYQIKLDFGNSNPYHTESSESYKAILINNAVEYCDPIADSCILSHNWPTVTITYSVLKNAQGYALEYYTDITNPAGKTARYTQTQTASGPTMSYRRPGSTVSTLTTSIDPTLGLINGVVHDGVSYAYHDGINYYTVDPVTHLPTSPINLTSTDPSGGTTTYTPATCNVVDPCGNLASVQDGLGHVTSYIYDSFDRVTKITQPEGNYNQYTYDARANLTSSRTVAKPGSGLADIVKTAGYDATCSNPLTCNQPNWTKDAKNNETDYTYDPVHGGILTKTAPADAKGIRPQTRYSYVQRYAWILNSVGSYVHAGSAIWLLSSESFCRNSAATGNPAAPCTGGDEVRTDYDYGPDSGPNNLALRGKAVTADGVTRRTCFAYDSIGNNISQTTPRANLSVCP